MMKSWEVIELKPLEKAMTEEAYKKIENKILVYAVLRMCTACKVMRGCTLSKELCPLVNAVLGVLV